MKSILIPTDFTPASRQAIRFASQYFGHNLRRLILLNALTVPQLAKPTIIRLDDILKERSERGLRAEQEFAAALTDKQRVEVSTLFLPLPVLDATRQIIAREPVDIVILGMQPHNLHHPKGDATQGTSNWAGMLHRPVLSLPIQLH